MSRLENDQVMVHCAVSQFGNGQRLALAKIAAEILNVPLENVTINSSDTRTDPADFGAAGSRETITAGGAVGSAAKAARQKLLEEAARTYCIPVSVMERNDETAPSRVLESFALSAPSLSMLTGAVDYSTIVTSDTTFAWQSATIRRLAKEGPCVIIGRCADHVLRGTPGVVSLFLYADYEARVDHITQKYQLSRGDATILIDETEKERARYYKRHTGQEFARMENYDLCLNTASVNREMAILLLKAFVENQEN